MHSYTHSRRTDGGLQYEIVVAGIRIAIRITAGKWSFFGSVTKRNTHALADYDESSADPRVPPKGILMSPTDFNVSGYDWCIRRGAILQSGE